MPTLQVRDPVEPLVLVKTDDLPVQNGSFQVPGELVAGRSRNVFMRLARVSTELAGISTELAKVSTELANVSAELAGVSTELANV